MERCIDILNDKEKVNSFTEEDKNEILKILQPFLTFPRTIQSSFKIDIELRFVAKVALSAGYFSYGDLFKKYVKHEELRIIMNNKPTDLGDKIYEIQTLIHDRFRGGDSFDQIEIFKAICQLVGESSIVGLVPGSDRLGIFVGILGHYIGMVNVPAITNSFPKEGLYHWGHIICPQNGKLVRISFRRVIEKLAAMAESK